MAIQRPLIIIDGGAVFPLGCAAVPAMPPANDFGVLPRDGPVHRETSGLPLGKAAAAIVDRIWFELAKAAS